MNRHFSYLICSNIISHTLIYGRQCFEVGLFIKHFMGHDVQRGRELNAPKANVTYSF